MAVGEHCPGELQGILSDHLANKLHQDEHQREHDLWQQQQEGDEEDAGGPGEMLVEMLMRNAKYHSVNTSALHMCWLCRYWHFLLCPSKHAWNQC